MDFKKEAYKVEFTNESVEEIKDIYEYISKNLIAKNAAQELMKKIRKSKMNLERLPKIYMKVRTKEKGRREFRRIVINNYIVLYTVDEDKRIIYISHMYYERKDYLS